MSENENVRGTSTRPARDTRPSLLELALAVFHGEISEAQALRILRGEDEEVQTSDA